MPLIPFPNVPNLPGVPSVRRSAQFPAAAAIGLSVIQGALWRIFQVSTQWGIFDAKGNALADPRKFQGLVGDLLQTLGGATVSTDSVEYGKEFRISDFPLERGSFANYNKVETAAAPRVTLCMSGSESERSKFLSAIDTAAKSVDLYNVVTPEATYINYSIESYNYSRRSSKGATLLIVEISLKEIRQVSSQYSQSAKQIDAPKNVGATPQADNGKVQAKAPEVSTLKSLTNKLGLTQ